MNTPNRGPEVADVNSMDDSITPDKRLTPKAIPMMRNPYTTPINLMDSSWCLSFIPFKEGIGLRKSSKVTVAKEFKFDTFRLQKRRFKVGLHVRVSLNVKRIFP